MRSAQSRLGVVTSLGLAGRGVGRCINALPVPMGALKVGAAAFAGLAGAAVLRSMVSRRPASSAAVCPPPASSGKGVGRYLISEALLTLLLPLCRRWFLGDNSPQPGSLADKLLGGGQ